MKIVLKLHDHITISQADKIADEMKAYGEVAIEFGAETKPKSQPEPEVQPGDQAAPKTEPKGKLKTVLTFDELYHRWVRRKYFEKRGWVLPGGRLQKKA